MAEMRKANWKEVIFIIGAILAITATSNWAMFSWRSDWLEKEFAKKADRQQLDDHIKAFDRLVDAVGDHGRNDMSPDAEQQMMKILFEVRDRQINVLTAIAAIQSQLNSFEERLRRLEDNERKKNNDRSYNNRADSLGTLSSSDANLRTLEVRRFATGTR